MPDYHKMYLHLFNEVTRAINILQEAQTTAEEMYISAKDSPISLIDGKAGESEAAPSDEKPEQKTE